MNAKSILFSSVLPQLKAESPYFTTATITRRVKGLGLEIRAGTLPVYLSRNHAVETEVFAWSFCVRTSS